MYRLTRDDGAELRVSGSVWEAALELAYLYGWRPVGTETPPTEAWRGRRAASTPPVWDSRDYFSRESQHVGQRDAHALAGAVFRALEQIPEWPPAGGESACTVGAIAASPVPSRASAVADGLSVPRRNLMHRFATFADCGGFTIGRST